jgi:hypothetical protein
MFDGNVIGVWIAHGWYYQGITTDQGRVSNS